MSDISQIPIEIACSSCHTVLVQAHLDVETATPIARSWILVDRVELVCPSCGVTMMVATDDFTRVVGDEWNEEDGSEP